MYMDKWVTPPKGVTLHTWGPPPPSCKQALSKQTGLNNSVVIHPYLSWNMKVEIQSYNKFCMVLDTLKWVWSPLNVPGSYCKVI